VLPLAAALGVVVGLAATMLSSALYRIEDMFHRLPVHWMWWPALGGLAVGLGGLIEPRVLGAGYGNITALLADSLTVRAIALLLVVKALVWLVALASGTSGGVLAPLLIMGGAVGALAGQALPGSGGTWALVGMAAMMSAAMRAPLTGAIFAIELTGCLDMLPATLAAAGTSYALAVLVLRRSILTEKIARRGRHIQQEFSVDPWALARVDEVMTRAPETLPAAMRLAEALVFFQKSARHRSYPVVNEAGTPVGLASRVDALRWRASEPGDASLGESVSDAELLVATPEMPVAVLADLMAREDIARVPVIAARSGLLVGIVARSDLLKVRLRQHRENDHREGLMGLSTRNAPA
jgi:CBS domain-containing protein